MNVRWLSPPIFGVIILSFFLPFLAVSCQGQGGAADLVTLTGLDLVLGGEPEVNEALTAEQFGGEVAPTDETDPEPFAIAAFGLAIVGLAIGWLRPRLARVAAGVAALLGIVALIVLRFRLESQVSEQAGGEIPGEIPLSFSISYKPGYWIALLLFAAAAVVEGVSIVLEARREPAGPGPPARVEAPPPPTEGLPPP